MRSLSVKFTKKRAMAQLDAVQACIDDQRVVQITAVPADHRAAAPMLAQQVRAALDQGATGLLLEGFGPGNVPAGDGAMAQVLGL